MYCINGNFTLISMCQSVNLKLINGPGHAGILIMGFDISGLSNVHIINQSITGFYEQVIDLKTI